MENSFIGAAVTIIMLLLRDFDNEIGRTSTIQINLYPNQTFTL